jgi:hypothetical protein
MNAATLPQFHGINGRDPVSIDQFVLPKGIAGMEALAMPRPSRREYFDMQIRLI